MIVVIEQLNPKYSFTKPILFLFSFPCSFSDFLVNRNLSNLLQSEQLNYAGAATCICATEQTLMSNLRSETKRLEIWEETADMTTKLNVAVGVDKGSVYHIIYLTA